MRIKKIDILLIRSFIPPLLLWTAVAMFIFNMQFLWKYIDDIVGKGLALTIVFELLIYQAIAMLPRALVFGVMIASVMTMGSLAEHYELVSLKSAGLSLFRVMRPLIVFCTVLAISSFLIADQVIPNAALKFRSRLHDIRRQKPTLTLEKGQFNNDFRKVVIYIGDKSSNGKELSNVKIYDHSENRGNSNQTNAAYGQLYYLRDTVVEEISRPTEEGEPPIVKDTTLHKSFLVVRLADGIRYEEMRPNSKNPSKYPHMRMRFKTFTSMFDMSEFEFNKTDEKLFRNHHAFKKTNSLIKGIDSLHQRRKQRMDDLEHHSAALFHYQRIASEKVDTNNYLEKSYTPVSKKAQKTFDTKIDQDLEHFVLTIDTSRRHYLYDRALGFAQNIKSQAENAGRYFKDNKKRHVAHENEVHQKLSFAFACILFLFIGAPMGAIIRKGGFGLPILVAFVFFMIFFILFMTGEKLAEGFAVPCWVGSWLPNLVLFPISVFLTYKAANDAPLFRMDKIKLFFERVSSLFSIRSKKK